MNLHSSREKEILERVINILKDSLDPAKIILFGSRGKGKNGRRSDFDVAVDQARPDDFKERKLLEEIEKAAGLYHVDVAYLKDVEPEFRSLVLKTGKVVYERRT